MATQQKLLIASNNEFKEEEVDIPSVVAIEGQQESQVMQKNLGRRVWDFVSRVLFAHSNMWFHEDPQKAPRQFSRDFAVWDNHHNF